MEKLVNRWHGLALKDEGHLMLIPILTVTEEGTHSRDKAHKGARNCKLGSARISPLQIIKSLHHDQWTLAPDRDGI
jgi:hypothetical protein